MSNLHARLASPRPATADADLCAVTSGIGLSGTVAGHRPAPRPATYEYPMSYETAYRALGLAKDIAAVNDILSIAAVMETDARTSNDRSLELDAIELRFHAECRLDDMVTDLRF
jgi:hypothetical protein